MVRDTSFIRTMGMRWPSLSSDFGVRNYLKSGAVHITKGGLDLIDAVGKKKVFALGLLLARLVAKGINSNRGMP